MDTRFESFIRHSGADDRAGDVNLADGLESLTLDEVTEEQMQIKNGGEEQR